MTYLSIDEATDEGRRLLRELKKSSAVIIHKRPNDTTRQALRDAKAGKGKPVKDVDGWFEKLAG